MPDDDIKRAIRAGWDAMSRSYQADSEISTSDLHYAPLAGGERYYRLLGDANNLRGLRALELACGGAQNSVALTKWGADVVALDFSPNQLRHALSVRRDAGARFDLVAGDMASPTMFKPESFDLILSSFGWEFAPDLGGCVAACAELLRPGGRLLMATGSSANRVRLESRGADPARDGLLQPAGGGVGRSRAGRLCAGS